MKSSRQKSFRHAARFIFSGDGPVVRLGSQDVEGDAAQDSEVLGSVILARSGVVLMQDDVERPVKLVLDAPVRSHDLQKAARGEGFI